MEPLIWINHLAFQWFGVPDSVAMEKVLPMHKNFPNETLFDKTKLFAGHTEQWGN